MANCNITQLLAYFPKLRADSSADVSTTSLNSLIDMQFARVDAIINKKQYNTPSPTTTPTTQAELLLHLLNIQLPVADLILRRSGNIDPFLRRVANTQRTIAEDNFKDLKNGKLWCSFSYTLPTQALCTYQEANAYASGFPIDNTTTPSADTVSFWCSVESSFVYAFMRLYNYHLDFNTMTNDQKLIYRRIVGQKVGSYITRMRATQFTALNENANILLSNYNEEMILFRNREYTATLK